MDEDELKDGAYPMYFGAFFALQLVSRPSCLSLDRRCRGSRIGEMMMLQGSACLLVLLLERVRKRDDALKSKLETAELEVRELKQRRAEDAKANEKVVSIFAAHEQNWIAERKNLRLQIQGFSLARVKDEEAISDLTKRVEEENLAAQMKDEALAEEAKKRGELEERLRISGEVVEELKERAKKEAAEYSSEIRKHKTALAELVSTQRQQEAELGRALQQVEAAKQELEEAFDRNEATVSMAEKLQQDADQKDKILSAMLRKSKLDTTEKQLLLKEVKIHKAEKKKAELDSEKWREKWESSHKKCRRALMYGEGGSSEERKQKTLLLHYLEAESRKGNESTPTMGEKIIATIDCLDQYSSDEADEQATNEFQQLQDWVRLGTEKYASILEQKYYAEIEAFTEQLRVKDEKLEAFSWKLLSHELETKRLQSHIDGLDESLSQLREENLKLEAMLLAREKEMKSVKEQLHFCAQQSHKLHSESTSPQSEEKFTMKSGDEEQGPKTIFLRNQHKRENVIYGNSQYTNNDTEPVYGDAITTDITTISSTDSTPTRNHVNEYSIIYVNELSSEEPERTYEPYGERPHTTALITQNPEEIEKVREVRMNLFQNNIHEKTETPNKSASVQKSIITKNLAWKTDIYALGVTYKIKRLKQQLLVLQKVAGLQVKKKPMLKDDTRDGSKERKVDKNRQQIKGFPLVMSVLNKQVQRYESLEEQTDELCKKMHEIYRTGSSREEHHVRPKEQSEMLGKFLDETFQLQRYMVATGQKLMEIQSRINCGFGGSDGFDDSVGFNKRQFQDIIKSLFREIQRGLEVRIARVIGDLEGTLASDGILRR